MAAVFAQMWVLCLVSFLLGALVTWLAVGPARRRPHPSAPAAAAEPMDPVQAAQAPPTPLPGVPRHARITTSPAGGLDRLRQPGPDPRIPQQSRRPGGLFTPTGRPEIPPRRTPGAGE